MSFNQLEIFFIQNTDICLLELNSIFLLCKVRDEDDANLLLQ